MKKLLALLVTTVMVASLTACGSASTETATESSAEAAETEAVTDAGTEETTEQTTEQTEQKPAGETESAEKAQSEQPSQTTVPEVFTLKVNKEERNYTRDEVISLAQKGADYDRVKEKLSGHQATIDALADAAKTLGMEIPQLLDTLRINAMVKKEGISEDVAKERLLRQKAEQENTALKQTAEAKQEPAETSQQRAQREIAEFRKEYPDVPLTDELLKALMPDVQKGISFKDAYERQESAKKDARIKELEAQLEAEKQNNKNRASSPGSQKDSGGRREKTDFDDFVSAFR